MMSSSSSSDSEKTPTSSSKFDDFDFFNSDNDSSKAKREERSQQKKPTKKVLTDDKRVTSEDELQTSEAPRQKNFGKSNKITGHCRKEKLTIHMPNPKEKLSSEDRDSSGSSVTDVSPLPSPELSPRPRSSQQNADRLHKTRHNPTLVKPKPSERATDEWTRARRSKGETLSISDLMYASDSNSFSSSEKEDNMEKRKKVLRKKKINHNNVHHRMEASTRHHRRRLLDVAAQNSMDISQLLEVVLEMEHEENMRKALSRHDYPKNLCHVPQARRKNMTFSRERARDIDIENERLYQRLNSTRPKRPSSATSIRSSASSCRTTSTRNSRRPATAMGARTRPTQGPRLYHSATNRVRDQQRIERENLAFLKRLQGARPSTSLRRDVLLHDYERQTGKALDATRPRRSNLERSGRYSRQSRKTGRPEWQDSW